MFYLQAREGEARGIGRSMLVVNTVAQSRVFAVLFGGSTYRKSTTRPSGMTIIPIDGFRQDVAHRVTEVG